MRVPQGTTLALWLCVMALACLLTGCPDNATNVDAAGDVANDLGDVASDLGDAGVDVEMDAPTQTDVSGDSRDASDVSDASDAVVPTCVPGMSIACACVDGRMGAQVCRSDFTYSPCQCVAPDAGTPDVVTSDVVLPPLGARLIAPQSVSRVTSRRPTMRWVLPDGVTRARVQVCADRPCTRMLMQQEVTGTSWRPTELLAPGVTYWRVRGLDSDGGVAWSSATWEFVVGQRDAPVDTSFGTIRDINGDGYDDIFVRENDSRSMLVFDGRSTMGAAEPSYAIPAYPYGETPTQFADFNGDGFADLATLYSMGVVHVRLGARGGLPQEPSISLTQPGNMWFGMAVAAGDFDGDGFSDLVVRSAQAPFDPPLRVCDLRIYPGGAAGVSASPAVVVSTPPGRWCNNETGLLFFAGDLNADGYADVLTSNVFDNYVWIVAGHPTLPLSRWVEVTPPGASTLTGLGGGTTVGDLNGDGVTDFAVAAWDHVFVYLGISGEFVTTPFRVLMSPSAMHCGFGYGELGAMGDFNGDGRADLVISDPCTPDHYGTVYIHPGTETGFAASPVIIQGMVRGGGPFGMGVGDFNHDGFGDLGFFQCSRSGMTQATVHVLLGDSFGLSWERRWSYPAGAFAQLGPGEL